MTKLIRQDKSLGYSSIYIDFLEEVDPARSFYGSGSIEEVAVELDEMNHDRAGIVEILSRQNRSFGASQTAIENIQRVLDPKAVCLFTGQQAGLFTGPLLVIIKALSIVKAARLYSEKLSRPVVPIFWIAGDDHDFEEANHTVLLDRHAEPTTLAYGKPPAYALPTSEILFSDEAELERVRQLMKDSLGQTDFTDDLYRLVDSAYTTSDTMVSAFGKLMAALFADYGLILFNPGDEDAKKMAAPFFEAIVQKQENLHDLLASTNQRIRESGYHIQVEKKENATHLFYNHKGRLPVMREGSEFVAGEERFGKDELIALIEEHPGRFSPDVMTRPALQSFLFPVLSQKGGPAEIAYLAQINPVFKEFGLATPFYMARPSATFIEQRYEKLMGKHDIGFDELAGDIETVVNRVLGESFPADLESRFEQLRKHVECHFEDFQKDSLKFDSALEKFASQTYGKIDFTLKAFEGKVFSSHKKKSKETRERIYRLYHAVYTNRGFQERSLNVTYFLSKYGRDFISFMYDQLDPEEKSHQLIYLSKLGS